MKELLSTCSLLKEVKNGNMQNKNFTLNFIYYTVNILVINFSVSAFRYYYATCAVL